VINLTHGIERELIIVIINGKEKKCQKNLSIKLLLDELNLSSQKLAVELNGEIVPRSELANTFLTHKDKIEIISAIGGG